MQFNGLIARKNQQWVFGCCVLVLWALLSIAANKGLDKSATPITPALSIVSADTHLTTVWDAEAAKAWQPSDNPLTVTASGAAAWVRISLTNSDINGRVGFIKISNEFDGQVNAWIASEGSQSDDANAVQETKTEKLSRVKSPGVVFQLPRMAEHRYVYLEVTTVGAAQLAVSVWDEPVYWQYLSGVNLALGMFYGLLLAVAICNIFFFFTTRSAAFLYYTGYVTSLGLTLASLQGYASFYLWAEYDWQQGRSVTVFCGLTIMFVMVFSSSMLELASRQRRLANTFIGLAMAFGVLAASGLLFGVALSLRGFLVLFTSAMLFITLVSIWLAKQKVLLAGYYALATGTLLLSACSATLAAFNVLSFSWSAASLLTYGAVVEVLVLVFILAINYGRQQSYLLAVKENALEQESEALKAKQALVDMQQSAQEELEYKVGERTLELEIALRELSDANRELEKLNTIDPLTGIKNRRYFDKRLTAEGRRSRREQTPLALVMVDIDHFKSVNDRYGHSAGDACIKQVASVLETQLKRPSDDACRYGGEEFGLILPNTDLEGARQLIESMRTVIESQPCYVDGQQIALTISAGVACGIIDLGEDESSLLKLADERLYIAKQSGRNRVVAK